VWVFRACLKHARPFSSFSFSLWKEANISESLYSLTLHFPFRSSLSRI
jgi:hypothetical protein